MDIKSINIFKSGVGKCLGDLEQAILDRLWASEDPLSARAVTDQISDDHAVSFNAVSTVLNRLEKKKLVKRIANGKRYRFSPTMSKSEYSRSILVEGITSLLSDKTLLSAAGLSGRNAQEEIDKKTLKLLKDFIDYAD